MCGNLCRGLVSPRGRLATVQLLPITLDSVFRALITLQERSGVFSLRLRHCTGRILMLPATRIALRAVHDTLATLPIVADGTVYHFFCIQAPIAVCY